MGAKEDTRGTTVCHSSEGRDMLPEEDLGGMVHDSA